MSQRLSYALAVLILLLASVLRIWDFTTLPAGLSEPELQHVNLMQDEIKRGEVKVFYAGNGEGQEGIYHMLLAISTLIFGTGTLGLRVPSLLASLLALALLYSLGTRLYGRIAGLAAMLLGAVLFWQALLARLIMVEAFLPLLITGVLLALARAMPVYTRMRLEASNTQGFAVLGILLGFSLYVHPAGLMLVLAAMGFIGFIIILRRPLSLRWLSYIGFAILMMIIVAMPYLLSTIRLRDLDASGRIFGDYGSISLSVLDGLIGLMVRGDSSPLHNLPERPMMDLVTGFFVLVGLTVSLQRWREPRYALVLIAALFLAPPALLTGNSPNFLSLTLVLPIVALLFGLGIESIWLRLRSKWRVVAIFPLLALLTWNVYWTWQDLFVNWQGLESVQVAYNAELGQIAHYLDTSANRIPTVFCYPNWDVPHKRNTPLSPAEQVLLLLNNDSAHLHYVDCRSAFLFINGGARQQVIIPSANIFDQLPPDIVDWLSLGQAVETLPERSVIIMEVQAELADALGVYTTTTPASYETDTDTPERIPVPPPIRFGGNITWLGYETDPQPIYFPNERVTVTSYWRVDGIVPPDLKIFTHILSDPVTLVANRDTMYVNPEQLEKRDIFIHTVSIPVASNIAEGRYEISIGAYRSTADARVEVFATEGEIRGDRIFLYPIEVIRPNQ